MDDSVIVENTRISDAEQEQQPIKPEYALHIKNPQNH